MPATATRKKGRRAATNRRSSRRPGKRPITPEDLLEFKLVGSPQVSPDGARIVFTRKHVGEKNEYVSNLWIVNARGDEAPRQFTSGGRDSHPRWSPDGSSIAFIGAREKHQPQIYVIGAGGGEAVPLTKFPEGALASFQWAPDGTYLAASVREQDPAWTEAAKKQREEKGLADPPRVLDDWWYRLDGDGYFNAQRFHLYRVEVDSGAHRLLYDKDTLGLFSFDIAPDSRQIVVATNRHRQALVRPELCELIRIDAATGRIVPIPNLPEGPKACPKWSPDGSRIAYAGRKGEDDIYSVENLELWVCDPVKGNARSLTRKTDHCLLAVAISDTAEVAFGPSLQWRPDSRRILFKLGRHGQVHIASIRPSGGAVDVLTRGRIDHDMGNCSGDSSTIALTASEPTKLAEIHAGDLSDASIRTTPRSNFNGPILRQRTLAKPAATWLTTADDTKVHLWTMLPPGFSPRKKYPAVLEIHGGPHAQYGEGFFHEFQAIASAGYIVFYANPRGSKGYGQDHTAAIKGHWGTADWTDMQAVIAHMKAHPNVNVKKMGVMGGSYGGYMTNWIIGHSREFAGAITDRCVSNLVSMGGSSDWVEKEDGYFPGNFWDRPEPRWDQSPIKFIGNARTPTLVIHSEGDLRCNIEQAEQVFTALKLLNVPTRFVRYPRSTSHGMSRGGPPDLRLHRLHQILDWWKLHLQQ